MTRFTISLDDHLARQFEHLISERHYGSRSEAVRDLIHLGLARMAGAVGAMPEGADASHEATVLLALLLDPHDDTLCARLDHWRQAHRKWVRSSSEQPLDADRCLQLWVMHGPMRALHSLAGRIGGQPGILQVTLNVLPTGRYDAHGARYEVRAESSYPDAADRRRTVHGADMAPTTEREKR